jgi:glycine betaine/proline transport system substrate-binding protein
MFYGMIEHRAALATLGTALLVLSLLPCCNVFAQDAPVRIGVPPWQGAVVKTAVVTEILEQAGFRVETTSAAAPLIFQELAAGRLDVNLSAWVPGQDAAFMPLVERGDIMILGENLEGARTGLAVPAGIHADGVRSIHDLAARAQRFDRTIHCIEPGSGANQVAEDAVEQDLYGLGEWRVLSSSTQAMLAQLDRAQRRDEAIVICAWQPHWMNIAHELHYLEDPLEHWGGEGRTRVHTLARKGLAEDRPRLADFLERFRISAAVQSRWVHEYGREGREPRNIARDWVQANRETVEQWLGDPHRRSKSPEGPTIREARP